GRPATPRRQPDPERASRAGRLPHDQAAARGRAARAAGRREARDAARVAPRARRILRSALRPGRLIVPEKVNKTGEEWRRQLTPQQYEIMRRQGTERPWSGEHNATKAPGVFQCAGCGAELFRSDAKFESGSGWPSFFK